MGIHKHDARGYMKEVLTNNSFLKLMLSNAFGRFSDSLDAITFSWLMYLVSGNATLIALIYAANYLPTIALQPFTGVLADRFSKKRIVAFCDGGRAALALGTCGLYIAHRLVPWMLFPLTLLISTFEAFRMPSGTALIPELVGTEYMTAGNALNQTLRRICEAIGTAAAGIIIAAFGCSFALVVDGIFFALSGVLVFSISLPYRIPTEQTEKESVFRGFTHGLRYLQTRKYLWYLLFLMAAVNLLSVPLTAFQSVFFGDVLALTAAAMSFCNTAQLVCMTLGAVAIAKYAGTRDKKWKNRLMWLTVAMFLPLYLGLTIAPSIFPVGLRFIVVIAFYAVYGMLTGTFSVLLGGTFMEQVEPDFLGRITGLSNSLGLSVVPISSLLCSSLSVYLNVQEIYGVIAGITVVILLVDGIWRCKQ